MNRKRGAQWFKQKTGKEPSKTGLLHSEDLDAEGLLKHLEEPKPVATEAQELSEAKRRGETLTPAQESRLAEIQGQDKGKADRAAWESQLKAQLAAQPEAPKPDPAAEAETVKLGPGAKTAKAQAEVPETLEATGLKNAVADLERTGLGLKDAPPTVQRNMAAAWVDAGNVERIRPGTGADLANRLRADPNIGLTDTESALLLRHKVDLWNKLNDAAERTHKGTPEERKLAQAEHDGLLVQFDSLLDSVKRRGEEWGREGRWRQAMSREDFTFTSRDELNRYHRALTGEDLPADKTEQADRVAKQVKTASDAADQAQEKVAAVIKKAPASDTPQGKVWAKAKELLASGMEDFDDLRNKIATDLGMSVDEVTKLLAKNKSTKRLVDDLWNKQQQARRLKEQAKRFVAGINEAAYQRAIKSIPRLMFSLKVGLHGTVALGTHAPMVAFDPRFTKAYVRNFGKMYKMVFSPAYYEMQMQNLKRRPNYIPALRSELVVDPFQYEEYHTTAVQSLVRDWLGPKNMERVDKLTSSGNRGYSVLKLLRMDMFDQMWADQSLSTRIPEVAEFLSADINHSTGVTKGKSPPGTHLALFAPRLEGSRVAWLVVDPAKALATFADWKNASVGERAFAMNQLKSKARIFGTFVSLLALNQGFLTASKSKQKINGIPKALGGAGINPMEGDFMKFKAAGFDVAYGSAMLNMAKLPVRLATAIMFEGKTSKLILEDERVYKIAGDYLRSQMSPTAGTATDLALGRDYAGRPLPRKGFGLLAGDTDIPKRLRLHGVTKPYTQSEYWGETLTPIPISEGIREVWGQGLGMSPKQIDHYLRAWAIISLMAGTGTRVTDDYKTNK